MIIDVTVVERSLSDSNPGQKREIENNKAHACCTYQAAIIVRATQVVWQTLCPPPGFMHASFCQLFGSAIHARSCSF